jgi:hypothetical protein
MKKNLYRVCSLAFVASGVIIIQPGCKSENGKTAQDLFGQGGSDKKDTAAMHVRSNKVQSVFYNIPSAVEISQLLKESGAKYSENYPSDPGNVSKYTSQKGESMNLGIYAADLSYAGIYEQKEEAMLYLKCSNQLATSLGIPDAFGESTISRIEANMGNQDSLLKIITEDYWHTDSYLKNNDRQQESAMIMAGGWIEGLYIATQIAAHTNNNPGLVNRVAEQKLSLNDLVGLVSTYPSSDPGVQSVLSQLKKIQDAYAPITVEAKTKISTDSTKNTTTIGGNEKVLMTPEQLKNITDVTATVRNQITLEY